MIIAACNIATRRIDDLNAKHVRRVTLSVGSFFSVAAGLLHLVPWVAVGLAADAVFGIVKDNVQARLEKNYPMGTLAASFADAVRLEILEPARKGFLPFAEEYLTPDERVTLGLTFARHVSSTLKNVMGIDIGIDVSA